MNQNKNKHKNKKKNIRYKGYNHKGRSKFNIARYNQKTKPSTFGPGSYRVSLTKFFRGSLENQVSITLYSEVIVANPEYDRIKNDFKYIRIEGIAITFLPRNLPLATNQTPAYMILNYDGTTTKNVRLQDSAKVIPAFLTKPKMYKYNIPKMNSFAGIMNGWYNVGDIAYLSDLMLQVHAPNNTTEWYFKIDVIITMRGPTNEEDENKNQEVLLTDVIKRMKEKECGKLQIKTFAESTKQDPLSKIKNKDQMMAGYKKKKNKNKIEKEKINKENEKDINKVTITKEIELKNEIITNNEQIDEQEQSYSDDWGEL